MDTLVWLHVIFACFVSPVNGWKVMGVRMCQEQCQNRRGCVAVAIDAAHLMCTLLSKRTDFLADSTLTMLKVLEKEAALKDCHHNDRLVVNRKKQPSCVPTAVSETVTTVGYVIMVPQRSEKMLYYKISIPRGNVTSMLLRFRFIQGVAYLKDRNRIVVATQRKIVSTSVTFKGKKNIRKCVNPSNLLADEEDDHLFLSKIMKSNVQVYRMTLKGQKLSTVFNCRSPNDPVMEIDTKHKRIFICVHNDMLSYTYDGIMSDLNIRVRALAFYCGTSSLYLATAKSIAKTSNGKTKMVARFKVSSEFFSIYDMIRFGNHLYVTGLNNDNVMIRIDLSGRHQKIIKIMRKRNPKDSFAMVGLPQN